MVKYSRQREAVLKTLCNTKMHPTAAEVYDAVRLSIPNISLATVYRNLKGLAEEGKAQVIISGDGKEHYDAFTLSHAHFCCNKCNKIYDISQSVPDFFGIETEHRISNVSLNFSGICTQCL